jgi:hypothetical protein
MESLHCTDLRHWDIILSPDAIPAERYAAEEFQRLFAQATRIQLPIRYHAEQPARHVYIGPSASLDVSGLTVNLDALEEEDFQITIDRARITLVGGRPRGTLYAVYQFLEDYLGVRFLTYDHTHIPDAADARIPCGTTHYHPPFSFRWSYYRENSEHPEFAARLRVNTVPTEARLGGKTGQSLINHTFHWLMPFSEYGAAHPEYYALVDGVRDTHTHGGGPQFCVTNPDVIRISAEAVIRYLNEHPEAKNVSVSQADTDRYCRCEVCEAINQREGTPMGAQLAFVNAVAERVEQVHPHVKIGTLAYWYTRKPPKTIRPRHNVQVQLCSIECCTIHPIDDPTCPRNREFYQDMTEWAKICNDIWIWNYNTNFRHYDLPFPNLRCIGPNVRYFLHNNAKGVFMQANGNGLSGELSDLRNYLIARLLWNPALDDRAVLEEFVQLHYQGAAAPILECIDLFHDHAWQSGNHPDCFPSPDDVALTPEIARQMLALFQRALELADDEAVRARVEKASICAYRAMIEAGGRMTKAERAALVERYISLCQTYQMTHLAETQPFDPARVDFHAIAADVDPAIYERYAGTYELVDAPARIIDSTGTTVALSVQDGRLLLETSRTRREIYPQTETRFFFGWDHMLLVDIVQDATGQVVGLQVHLSSGDDVYARKL